MDKRSPTYKPQQPYQARYAKHFATWRAFFDKHAFALALLRGSNKALTWVFYVAYALLLIWAFSCSLAALAIFMLAPALGFVLMSWFRSRFNAPRPATACGISPLVERDGEGKSFQVATCFLLQPLPLSGLHICPLRLACYGFARFALGFVELLAACISLAMSLQALFSDCSAGLSAMRFSRFASQAPHPRSSSLKSLPSHQVFPH